jgi:hypothetical protein
LRKKDNGKLKRRERLISILSNHLYILMLKTSILISPVVNVPHTTYLDRNELLFSLSQDLPLLYFPWHGRYGDTMMIIGE